MRLWVSGRIIAEGRGPRRGIVAWELLGVFSSQEKAAARCELRKDFVAPVTLDEPLSDLIEAWPGLILPRAGAA